MNKLYIGTSGYNYKDWKGKFYPGNLPQKKWLSYYAELFNTVEINATFYGSFKQNVFENWANQTGKDFYFTLKGSRFITHVRRLINVEESVERFFEQANGLGNKLSIVLWQFPPNLKLNTENLKRIQTFIENLPKNICQVFEFRDESWFTNDVFKLLNTNNMGFVINDSGVYPSIERVTGKIAYLRFHGPTALYSSSYSSAQLNVWAERVKEYLKQYDVYCYFNNDINGYAIQNAITLRKLINSY